MYDDDNDVEYIPDLANNIGDEDTFLTGTRNNVH